MMRIACAIAACAILTACGDGDGGAELRDESKLSTELEQRAQSIEARAQEGVAAAEREAATDLARLNEEAATSAAASADVTTDPTDPSTPSK